MKKIIIVTFTTLLVHITLYAQDSINSILSSIEKNNTTLKALRTNAESDKLNNKIGTGLPDPQVGFSYLWGNPSELGQRANYSVSQTFDIPTVIGMKSKLTSSQNNLIEWQYRTDRMNLLLEAKQYCIELIYYNALSREMSTRLHNAQVISDGYQNRLTKGDTNVLEYNKVKLNIAYLEGEMSRIEVERSALLSQLKRLNGGSDVFLSAYQYDSPDFPLSYDEWYLQQSSKNPTLALIREEVEVSKRREGLVKAMRLPSLSIGYMCENVVGPQFKGISLGITIPLWENRNKVRQAKSAVHTAVSREIDTKQQFSSKLRIAYDKAWGLKKASDSYRNTINNSIHNAELLKKALDAGEISLLDYMIEMRLYYDIIDRALAIEKEFQLAYAELSAVEL